MLSSSFLFIASLVASAHATGFIGSSVVTIAPAASVSAANAAVAAPAASTLAPGSLGGANSGGNGNEVAPEAAVSSSSKWDKSYKSAKAYGTAMPYGYGGGQAVADVVTVITTVHDTVTCTETSTMVKPVPTTITKVSTTTMSTTTIKTQLATVTSVATTTETCTVTSVVPTTVVSTMINTVTATSVVEKAVVSTATMTETKTSLATSVVKQTETVSATVTQEKQVTVTAAVAAQASELDTGYGKYESRLDDRILRVKITFTILALAGLAVGSTIFDIRILNLNVNMKKDTKRKILGKLRSVFITLCFLTPTITRANSELLPIEGTKLAEERLPEILSVLSEVKDNADACEVMTEIATDGYFIYPGYICDLAMRPIKWKKWFIRSQSAKTIDDIAHLLRTSDGAKDPSEGSLAAGIGIGKAGMHAISDSLQAGAAMVKVAVASTTRKFRSDCTTDECKIMSDALLHYISTHSKSTAMYVLHNPRYRPLAVQVVQIVRPLETIGKFITEIPTNYVNFCKFIGIQPFYLIVLIACLIYLNVDDVEAHVLVIVYFLTLIYSFTIGRLGRWAITVYNGVRDLIDYINSMSYTQFAMFVVCGFIASHIRAKMASRSHLKNIGSTMVAIAILSFTTSISMIHSAYATLIMMLPGVTNATRSRRYIQKYVVLAIIVLIVANGMQQSEAKESTWDGKRIATRAGYAVERIRIQVGDDYPIGLDPQIWLENLVKENFPDAVVHHTEIRKYVDPYRDKCEMMKYLTGWNNLHLCNFSYYVPQMKVMRIETRRTRAR